MTIGMCFEPPAPADVRSALGRARGQVDFCSARQGHALGAAVLAIAAFAAGSAYADLYRIRRARRC